MASGDSEVGAASERRTAEGNDMRPPRSSSTGTTSIGASPFACKAALCRVLLSATKDGRTAGKRTDDQQAHVLRRCSVVTALAVLLSLAALSCGEEATPQGLIAFSHGVGDDIFVMSLADGRIHAVTSIRGGQFDPSWSPDRKRLVFRDSRAGVNRNDEIYVVNADGTNARNLTHESANDWSPAWSPDGQTIVFASERFGQLALWTMRSDGSDVRRLTDGMDDYPAWSPDTRQIAFGRGLPLSDIWVADRDGLHERQLTSDPDPEWLPAWSPDGREIAYVRGFEGHGTI